MADQHGRDGDVPRRRRTHRRATRPATGGGPGSDVAAQPGRDDTDAGWAPDAPDDDAPRPAKQDRARAESAEDRWWRDQRPPHWE